MWYHIWILEAYLHNRGICEVVFEVGSSEDLF